eukprot:gb/GEZN01014745.1/.p1 GENE.gb/GEZN01014745.1/~~gb/GEZN01014745.1/.p1  ORF type:complete len:270 (+),score=26.87 gb/GEZN01014745.1/:48-857(+)
MAGESDVQSWLADIQKLTQGAKEALSEESWDELQVLFNQDTKTVKSELLTYGVQNPKDMNILIAAWKKKFPPQNVTPAEIKIVSPEEPKIVTSPTLMQPLAHQPAASRSSSRSSSRPPSRAEPHSPSSTLKTLDLGKILKLVQQSKQVDNVADEEVILFVGSTGAGKSTTINFLAGRTMTVETKHRSKPTIVAENELKNCEIGQGSSSVTSCINSFPAMEPYQNYILLDSPGFSDTKGFLLLHRNPCTGPREANRGRYNHRVGNRCSCD